MENNEKSGFAITALILGIVGVVLAFVPIINNIAFFMGIIAIVFAIIALVKKKQKGMSIAGLVLGIFSLVITLGMQAVYSSAWKAATDKTTEDLNEISENLDDISGDNTDEVLGKDVNVDLGQYSISQDQYSLVTSDLPVTVTNLTDETKSYMIELEAVASDGSRIKEDYVYVNDLGAGQSQKFDSFAYIASDQVEAMKTATFRVVTVSMY